MKRIPALITVLLVAQCLTGCFSTAYRMNSGMSAGTGAGTAAGGVAAGALDVVTLPIQAPFLVGIAASNPSLMSGNAKEKSTVPPTQTQQTTPPQQAEPRVRKLSPLEEIRKDPEHLFTHRDSLSRDTVRMAILDRRTPFTETQLRQLGRTNEWTRTYVAANPRCPQDLLEDIWRELPTLPDTERASAAANLVSNPNVPIAWLLEIMKRRDLYAYATDKAAGQYYWRTRSPTPPPGSPPSSVPPSPGK